MKHDFEFSFVVLLKYWVKPRNDTGQVISPSVIACCYRYSNLVWLGVRKSQPHKKQQDEDSELMFVCFLLSNSPASEFYMPTFRNTLFHLHRQVGTFYTPTFRRTLFHLHGQVGTFYMPTFRSTLFHLHRLVGTYLAMKMEQSVPKRRYIKFRSRGITQKKHRTFRTLRKFEIKNGTDLSSFQWVFKIML